MSNEFVIDKLGWYEQRDGKSAEVYSIPPNRMRILENYPVRVCTDDGFGYSVTMAGREQINYECPRDLVCYLGPTKPEPQRRLAPWKLELKHLGKIIIPKISIVEARTIIGLTYESFMILTNDSIHWTPQELLDYFEWIPDIGKPEKRLPCGDYNVDVST